MIRKLLLSIFGESDAQTLSKSLSVMLTIAGVALIASLFWLFRKSGESESEFRARETDREPLNSKAGNNLGEARIQSKPQTLRLSGIRVDGAPHEILGVSQSASAREIQAAYRDLMKRYHPDIVGRPGSREWADAQKIAEAINRAKNTLLKQASRH